MAIAANTGTLSSIDTSTLSSMISTLVDYSMDGRVPEALQPQCMVLAKRLRGTLVNLLSARFNAGTPAVDQANSELRNVNTQVLASINQLGSLSETLANVTNLVGQLDSLLSIAVKFA